MSFASPLFLLSLLLVPLLGLAMAVAARRRRRFALRFPALRALRASASPRPAWRRRVPAALTLLGVGALALALARPQATVAVPVEKASIMLVTDTSGSMSATDVAPSRLDAAQEAARDFLGEVPETVRVGALSYSDAARLDIAPTDDRDAVRSAIDGLAADGGTATGDALDVAVKALRQKRGDRTPAAVVLLSDGKTTAGRDPVPVAAAAKRLRVPIYTVALGTEGGTLPGPGGQAVPVPPDPETLAQIASSSGGAAFTADDADQLSGVYRKLGSQLGTKEEQREITAAFAAGGLLLLGAGLAGGLRLRPTLT
ncbi:MAG: VWA domain-containing protein [Solirubrobacterales bacterium]|nr:VWA domain-containing protein [Solirubrobacterales bacterium]